MNRLKIIGAAITTAVTMGNTSCTVQKLAKWTDQNFQYVIKSGMRADEFVKMDSTIFHNSKSMFDLAKHWEQAADKIKIQKAVDSTKTAVIDSMLKYNPDLKIPASLKNVQK